MRLAHKMAEHGIGREGAGVGGRDAAPMDSGTKVDRVSACAARPRRPGRALDSTAPHSKNGPIRAPAPRPAAPSRPMPPGMRPTVFSYAAGS